MGTLRRVPRRAGRGYTLVDMTVTLIVISVLTVATGYTVGEIDRTRASRARTDALLIYTALFGTRDANGFYGDVGRLTTPAAAANELVVAMPATIGSQNRALYGNPQVVRRGVTVGWRGPYTGYAPVALAADPWGRPWTIDATGRITSAGQDGAAGTSDDVSVPLAGHATLLPSGLPDGEIDVVVTGPDWPVVVTGLQASVQVSNVDGAGNVVMVNASAPSGGSPHFRATGLVTGRHVVVATAAPGSTFPTARAVGVGWVSGKGRAIVRVRLSRECCQGL